MVHLCAEPSTTGSFETAATKPDEQRLGCATPAGERILLDELQASTLGAKKLTYTILGAPYYNYSITGFKALL